MSKSARDVVLDFFREYFDAGHIVNINADVMAHKLADRLDIHWDEYGRQRQITTRESA